MQILCNRYGTGEGRIEPMFIADDFFFKAEDFIVPAHYKPYIDKIIIPHGLMLDKVEKLVSLTSFFNAAVHARKVLHLQVRLQSVKDTSLLRDFLPLPLICRRTISARSTRTRSCICCASSRGLVASSTCY